jgi:hypothetical protein
VRVPLTPSARAALTAASEVLAASSGSTLVPRSVQTKDAVTTVSDASSTGIGWLCEETQRYCSEPLPIEVTGKHINLLELAAAGAAAEASPSAAGGAADAPEPAEIITVARAIRMDRADRETASQRAEREAILDAKAEGRSHAIERFTKGFPNA